MRGFRARGLQPVALGVDAHGGGEITTRTVETGQFVQVGNVLTTLVDPRRLRLRFRVSESESLSTRVGQTVAFRATGCGSRCRPASFRPR